MSIPSLTRGMFLSTSTVKCLSALGVAGRKYSSVGMKTTTKSKIDLNGIFVPVPTPFSENHQQTVNYEKLKENLAKWDKLALKGYCIGGSNGEWPYLSDEEKLKIITTVKSTVHPSKLVIAGTTCESTEHTRELSQAAAEAGADAILVMTPNYFRTQMTEKVIIEHFTNIADTIPIPSIIYNNPFATAIDISLNCIEILSGHSNIYGIKDTDVAKLGCIVEKTRNMNFSVLAGSAGYLLPSLLMGCSGGINGLAAILGNSLCEIFALAQAKDWNLALTIQKQVAVPDFTILRETGPAGLKAAMDMMGYYGGVCRKPLLPLNEEIKIKIWQVLKASGFIASSHTR